MAARCRRYVNNTSLSSRVARLNPSWNEPYTDDTLDERFGAAMALTGALPRARRGTQGRRGGRGLSGGCGAVLADSHTAG